MMIIYNQIFLHRIPKNIADKERKNLIHIIEFFLQIQQIHEINNQYECKIHLISNTQSFQRIQPQNPMITHSYQPTQMQNEIPLPYYLQQHEITKNLFSNFSQMPNAAESLQMTMNPYLMGGSSITSNKPLMVFTGTDPESPT